MGSRSGPFRWPGRFRRLRGAPDVRAGTRGVRRAAARSNPLRRQISIKSRHAAMGGATRATSRPAAARSTAA